MKVQGKIKQEKGKNCIIYMGYMNECSAAGVLCATGDVLAQVLVER